MLTFLKADNRPIVISLSQHWINLNRLSIIRDRLIILVLGFVRIPTITVGHRKLWAYFNGLVEVRDRFIKLLFSKV